jgi:hypothetical protein
MSISERPTATSFKDIDIMQSPTAIQKQQPVSVWSGLPRHLDTSLIRIMAIPHRTRSAEIVLRVDRIRCWLDEHPIDRRFQPAGYRSVLQYDRMAA